MNGPTVASIAFRLCVYFVQNPQEELYTNDVALKFDTLACELKRTLEHAVRDGWIEAKDCEKGNSRHAVRLYAAGPALRRLIS